MSAAINADNLSAKKVIYVLATGGVDTLAIFLNIALLSNLGRRLACTLSFGFSGLCMLALLVIPDGKSDPNVNNMLIHL